MGLFNSIGLVNKDELLNTMRNIIHKALTKKIHDSNNIFREVFKINGLFYSDLDKTVVAPVVLIKLEDLTRLIAAEKVWSYYGNDDSEIDYDEEITRRQKEIHDKYWESVDKSV